MQTENEIEELFKAHITHDAQKIKILAELCLDQLDFDSMNGDTKEVFQEHSAMSVFRESFIDYYAEKSWPIDTFVEHDIESWIESHAEILTEQILINLRIQTDDCKKLAMMQNDVLQNLWLEVEKKLLCRLK